MRNINTYTGGVTPVGDPQLHWCVKNWIIGHQWPSNQWSLITWDKHTYLILHTKVEEKNTIINTKKTLIDTKNQRNAEQILFAGNERANSYLNMILFLKKWGNRLTPTIQN